MSQILRLALGAFFTALVSAAFAISFAAIIYTGDLAQYLERGIALTLLGAVVISVVGAFTLSFRGSILGPQDVPAILIATTASGMIAGAQLPDGQVFATLACLIALCAFVSGMTGVVVGRMRLAHIARFFPFPVLAGFLATTGLLLLMAGIGIGLSGATVLGWQDYLSADALLRWGLVVAVAIAMVVATRVLNGFLVMPFALIAALFGFYAIYAVLGYSMADLRSAGLLMGPFQEGGFLAALDPTLPAQADWGLILAQAPLILSVAAATLIGTTLNASGLELQLQQDFDINREVQSAGLANVMASLFGGIPGYHVVGETILANRLGLTGTIVGLSSAAGCAVLLVLGAGFLTALPVGFFAAVIAFLGVDLLYSWLWEERGRFDWSDYAIVTLIPLVAVAFGFLTAIAVGLMLACALFILSYARLNIVKSQSDLATRRSKVERPDGELDVLRREGQAAKVIELSGFLFFGSSSGLRTRLQDLMDGDGTLRWLVLDFRHVSGLDVSTRHILGRIEEDCAARGVSLALTGLPPDQTDTGAACYPSLDAGLQAIEDTLIAAAGDGATETRSAFDEVLELFSQNRLLGYAEALSLEAGEGVGPDGEASRDIYLVKTGALRITAAGPDGEMVDVAFVRPGAVVGEMANYTGGVRTAKITAMVPTSLIAIKMDVFTRLEADHPAIAATFHRLMAQVMARRLDRTTKLLRDLGA